MQARLGGFTNAVIQQLWQETPTVKGLRLRLGAGHGNILFSPGQWVDFLVPGLENLGGYSICSPPSQLQQRGTFDLCVKASRHPCALWVHQQATQAAEVLVKVGGSFTLAQNSSQKPSLFVAGGIGITALSSMIADLVEQQQAEAQAAAGAERRVPRPFILYSDDTAAAFYCCVLVRPATEPNEFALLKQLAQWHQQGAVKLQLHTSRVHGTPPHLQDVGGREQGADRPMPRLVQGRIDRQHLQAALQQLHMMYGCKDVVSYVCGPPQMTEAVTHILHNLGVARKDVHSEHWW